MALTKTDLEVGFVDLTAKTITEIGTAKLKDDSYKGKIVLTKNGIVYGGYLVGEPNETPYGFVQGFLQKDHGNEVIAAGGLYTDNNYTTAITGDATKLYYVEYQGSYYLYFYIQDYTTNSSTGATGAFVTVNKVYEQLHSGITDIETKTEEYSTSIGDLKGRVSTLESNYDTLNTTVTEQGEKITSVQEQVTSLYTNMGVANGIATLDNSGKVPSSQLPSYVDDVIEGYYLAYGDGYQFFSKNNSSTQNLITAEDGKIYIDLNSNLTYRWSGSRYSEISPSIALGETSSTAYPGNKGKATADSLNTHLADTSNPHNVTKAQVGLSNVDNTADKDKAVAQATKDGDGNNIANTYIKKSSIATSLSSSSTDEQVPSAKAVYNGTVNVVTLTQAEYDALTTKDDRTVYLVTDDEVIRYDYDMVNFLATNITTLTAQTIYTVATTLAKAQDLTKTVYVHCSTYGSTETDKAWRLVSYLGTTTDSLQYYADGSSVTNTNTGYVYGFYSESGAYIKLSFQYTNKDTARVAVVSNGSAVVTESTLGTKISDDPTSTSKNKIPSSYALSLVNTKAETALDKLTWYTEA